MKAMVCLLVWLIAAGALPAQTAPRPAAAAGPDDLATVKERAEAGEAPAQLRLADLYSQYHQKAASLAWYRRAAAQHNVEAESRLGELLLFGSRSPLPENQVIAEPMEGIRWTYAAATNEDRQAWLNLSQAYQTGTGVDASPAAAYAWLKLYAGTRPGESQTRLNQMALQLDAVTLRQATGLAEQLRHRRWPGLSPRAVAAGDPRLKLEGIVFGGRVALATINGRTLAEGETASLKLAGGSRLNVTCLQIKPDAVRVSVAGETEPRWLRLPATP